MLKPSEILEENSEEIEFSQTNCLDATTFNYEQQKYENSICGALFDIKNEGYSQVSDTYTKHYYCHCNK